MAEKLLMLALSPTMETGVISKWLKQEGDQVESGDVLCEVETDKAMMDYESPASGTLLKIVVTEGNSASIGDLIAIVGKQGEDISGLMGAAEAAGTAGASIQTAVGSSGATGSGASGTPGAAPSEPQVPPIAEPTGQAPAEPPATLAANQPSSSATVQAPPEKAAQTGQPAAQSGQPAAQPATQPTQAAQPAEGGSGFIRSTPLARKMAEMNNVKLDTVAGSGPDGRIIKADIEKAMAAPAAQPAAQPAAAGAAAQPAAAGTAVQPSAQPVAQPAAQPAAQIVPKAASPAPAAAAAAAMPGDVAIPVSGKRRIIAQRLSESMFSAPHYYLEVRVEADDMLAMRSQLNDGAETKVSINAVLIKFAAEALKRHPIVNSTWAGDTIIRHGRIDIGLAVAQEDGLITPVVRDCGNKGMLQIETELKDLIQRARSNALKPEEYTGATFTISSLGSFGIEAFTAIINPPGSAILAVGEIRKEPVVQPDESLKVRSVMRLTLSCDHRVIDGAVGAAFLAQLRDMLEQPICAIY